MSMDAVIDAQGLGKKYLLGKTGEPEPYAALRDVAANGAKNAVRSALGLFGGVARARPQAGEEFWALRDVSFTIRRGDVVGIIGRNGAGKSTLLKILSRITEPTLGRAVVKGRVASLLEVGTGFHPELSGRENIYLNGAILGMKRAEIRSRFDEIVAFAEVERFLDTPVKRYSSGMYVRLAFAVAAHLEPDILIVDEVLAVGDAAFQKKCLGRMSEVASGGRTVLFVSHNMAAVKSLTSEAIVLHGGRVAFRGPTYLAIANYVGLSAAGQAEASKTWGRGSHATVRSAQLRDASGAAVSTYVSGEPLRVDLEIETDGTRNMSCELLLLDQDKANIALASMAHFQGLALPVESGVYRVSLPLAPLHLAAGRYTLDVTTSIVNHAFDHYVSDAVTFDVLYANPAGLPWNFSQSCGYGAIALPFAGAVAIEKSAAALRL